MSKILIVDDNPSNIELINHLMQSADYSTETALSAMIALDKLKEETFDLVISDLMMPKIDGLQLLGKIKEEWPETEVILVTAHGSIPTAVEAIKKGAFGYILKPFEPEDIISEVKKVFALIKVRHENLALKTELARVKHANTMIGNTAKIREVFELIESVANTNATVLIQGESGTGKELVANAIHNSSDRKNNPFIKVACSALAENLLESELFGHEKGSFTGAIALKKGRFEVADGGTLFLDEIGEMSGALQVKLLRVLQEREFERVGGTKPIKTNVRIITATNRDLIKEMQEERFREDLYYRLNVISIDMPSLKERKEDIPLLVEYFLQKYKIEVNKNIDGISDKAMELLVNYSWPGNIRELQNFMERAIVLAKNHILGVADLPENIRKGPDRLTGFERESIKPLKEAKQSFEKQFLEKALRINKGNISRTADMIKLARKNLQEKIKTYAIDIPAILIEQK